MNFISGKCPNCGANVELDSSLTTTYCAYCGSQISVEEAVEKLKIELSGKIEKEEEKSNSGCLIFILKIIFFVYILPSVALGIIFTILEILGITG